ncbi:FAD binding domain-containing protein [Streptomyces sp. NPDC003393]
MKPPPFSYHRARSAEHAAELLAELGVQARVLAGGMSLMPMLNLRLASPTNLVDIAAANDLGHISRFGDTLVVGAMVRQSAVENSAEVATLCPLLHEAVRYVAHPPVRHRGTVVGSLAHASPVAELPCVALALDAEFGVLGGGGVRAVPAAEFFASPFRTTLRPGELVAEVRFPVAGAGTGQAWSEFAVRRGNFPVAGAAVSLVLDGPVVRDAAIALSGVADRPVRASAAEDLLRGRIPTPDVVATAAEVATQGLQPRPQTDLAAHILPVPASPVPAWSYRTRVARTQVRRALTAAVGRAGGAA